MTDMTDMLYCAWCGAERTVTPCPHCGQTSATVVPPSQEPCAYCGARPTWAATWIMDGQESTVFLCAACDDAEAGWTT
jgi:hypothetical protein